MRISIPGESMNGGPLEVPHYGDQIQDHANLNIPAEAKVLITYETVKGNYPDGTPYELRKPVYAIQNEEFGSLQTVLTSPRIAQQTIGLGFIDALDDAAILANVDEFDTDKDGISGKANYVWDVKTNTLKIGKFGWKSNQPSLEQQIAGAFNGDMGLTTYLFPENNCPSPQNDCANAPNGGAPEVTDRQLKHVLIYQAALAVPTRRDYKKENVLKGKNLFRELACIKCHVDNFVTDNNYAILPQIQNIQVRPYSDFLLHDMGEKLADNRPDFLASGREWRTQPLWGIGLIETVNNHTFLLHDGRARNIEEAILWHGGEAEKSKNDFMQLTQAERQYLLDFINSL
ncbi:di-heme oxidoredictase family protein [Aquimarina hainanensis]